MKGQQFSSDISLTFGGLTSILHLDGIFVLPSNPAAEVRMQVATLFSSLISFSNIYISILLIRINIQTQQENLLSICLLRLVHMNATLLRLCSIPTRSGI